jgi:hypothetical protein
MSAVVTRDCARLSGFGRSLGGSIVETGSRRDSATLSIVNANAGMSPSVIEYELDQVATFHQFPHHPLIGLRQRTSEAFERLQQDSPLRFGLDDAQRAEDQLRLRRNPNTELRIILDLLTTSAGWRPSRSASAWSSRGTHGGGSLLRLWLECRQKSYGPAGGVDAAKRSG